MTEIQRSYTTDAKISQCDFLQINRIACRIDGTMVSIEDVNENDRGKIYCPKCNSDVNFRRCVEKIDHFYHEAKISAMEFSRNETEIHKSCKEHLLKALKEKYPQGDWQSERVGKRINVKADLSGKIGDKWLVIEIQHSNLKLEEVVERTAKYTSQNIPVLWIIPLKKPLENGKFRPRLLERFLHEIYGGKCFYWDENNPSKIYSIHFELAYRYFYREAFFSNEKNEFFEELSYKKPYVTIKNAVVNDLIEITEDFNIRIPEKPFVILKTCPNENWKFNEKDCFVFDKKILLYDNKNISIYNKQDEMIMDYNIYRLKELEPRIITSGKKYKNCSIKDILKDKSYCLWLYNEHKKQGFIKGFNITELEDIISACKIKYFNS